MNRERTSMGEYLSRELDGMLAMMAFSMDSCGDKLGKFMAAEVAI